MNHRTSILCRRNLRAYFAAFITYVMLAGQVAPLALAATRAPRSAPASAPASAPPSKAAPRPAPLFAAPNITATKVDAWDDSATPDGKAEPGQTITYTVTITNTGDADATGVTFTDSVDANTSLVAGSVQTQPIAVPDTYNVIGNVRIQPNAAQGLLANDRDPDTGNNTGLTASGPSTSTQGGNVTISADGSFSYNPAPGFTGTDTFTYTITDATGKTDTAVATFNVGNGTATPGTNVVWFVNPSAPSGGDGRLTSPFNCYTGVSASCFSQTAADDPGDSIFLFSGAHTGGYALLANQKLVGQGASSTLASISGLTVQAYSDALPTTGGASPTITTTNVTAIPLPTGASNAPLLRGFTVGNVGTGTKISGTNFGTLTVGNSSTPDVILNGTGQALNLTTGTLSVLGGFSSVTTTSSATQGINLAGIIDSDGAGGSAFSFGSTTVSGSTTQGILIGTSNGDLNFGNTSVTGGTDGVSFQNNAGGSVKTFGTLGVSGGSGNAFLHGAGGGNVTVTGAATLSSANSAVSIANMGAATINFQSSVSATSTAAGQTGVSLSGANSGASLTFNSLTVQTNAGTGLNLASSATTATVTVTNNTGTINNTTQAASAIIANGITFNAGFTTVNSSGGTNGISLTNVLGTMNFGTGALSGSSGVEFLVSGGTASVTYNGTITQTTAARVIDVQSKTGGTMAFGGAITSNNGTGQGVFLNNNSSTTFSFTAGLALSTAGNDAFTATSSGTLNITQNNTSIVNTLATTTGQALKVTSTTIGASGLTFRSIASNGGTTTNGVTLDTTGSGNFTVTGNGTAASGGTIQNKGGTDGNTTQGIGIYLNAVGGAVSLTRMDIEGCQNYGIRGITVSGGFTLDNSTIGTTTKNGTAFTDAEPVTNQQGEASMRFRNLTGTVTLSNDSFDRGFTKTVHIHNSTAGSTLTLNITNSTLRQSLNSGNGGDSNSSDALFIQTINDATVNLNISGSHFTSYRQFGILTDSRDTSTLIADVGTCDFSNDNTGNVNASGGIDFGGGSASSTDVLIKYNIHNNTMRHGSGAFNPTNGGAQVVSGGVSGGVKVDGKILNNQIGVSGVVGSGAGNAADALRLFASGNNASSTRVTGSTHTRYLVQGNTIKRWGETGIQINARQGNATIDANVLGNIINEPGTAAQGAFAAIWVNSGALAADTNQVNIAIGSATVAADKNTMQDSDPSNATDVFLDKNTCAGCASTLNLYQNGSDAAGATTEAKARDVLVDDNNPTLDLLTGFTNGSAIGFIAGTPPQPTAPQLDPTGARNRGNVTQTLPPALDSASTPTRSGVTSTPFVSPRSSTPMVVAPRTVAPATPTRTTANTSTASNTRTTGGSTTANRELTPVIDGAGGTVSVNIGTLAPGDSVTITFQVVIDNPYTGGPNVSNQGTVSGSNFSNVLTDDPAVVGSNNPTLTPINLTNIQVNDAKQPEPPSGTSQMLFTVTLSSPAGPSGVSVNYATANGGATPATGGASCDGTTDYITASGTLSIPSGSKTGTIPVTICSDSNSEGDETLLMNISSPSTGNITDAQATGTITANTPGTFIISEFRTRGSAGAGDDFVELYNNTNSPLTVAASDASAGYGVYKMGATCNDTPVLVGTIPNGTVIPARGHYLLVGSAYSLANYGGTGAAAGNLTMTSDIEDDRNIAVFSTGNIDNISSANRLDAVGTTGNTGNVCDLMHEGTSLAPVGAQNIEYSYFRKECDFAGGCQAAGNPKDSNDNSADFMFADTQGTFISGISQHLGAPGPENLASPIRRDNAGVLVPLLDASKASSAAPNRDRTFTPAPPTAPNGVLSIRRRVQNTTGATVTRLRFRIIEMTTFPSPGTGTADLRAITSSDVVISGITDAATCASTGTPTTTPCQVTVKGTTLETPPAQPNGGGYNSTFSVSIPGGLANNASVDVNFALGVAQGGTFRFYIIVEALP